LKEQPEEAFQFHFSRDRRGILLNTLDAEKVRQVHVEIIEIGRSVTWQDRSRLLLPLQRLPNQYLEPIPPSNRPVLTGGCVGIEPVRRMSNGLTCLLLAPRHFHCQRTNPAAQCHSVHPVRPGYLVPRRRGRSFQPR